jgi:hypothetical protein
MKEKPHRRRSIEEADLKVPFGHFFVGFFDSSFRHSGNGPLRVSHMPVMSPPLSTIHLQRAGFGKYLGNVY